MQPLFKTCGIEVLELFEEPLGKVFCFTCRHCRSRHLGKPLASSKLAFYAPQLTLGLAALRNRNTTLTLKLYELTRLPVVFLFAYLRP